MVKCGANLISPTKRLQGAPRCNARAKRSGERCKCPAVKGWTVCRVHGARGGAPSGERHPNYLHGCRAKEFSEIRKKTMKLCRMSSHFR